MKWPHVRWQALGGLAALLAVAACDGSDPTSPGGGATMTPAEVNEAAAGFEDATDFSLAALFSGGTMGVANSSGGVALSVSPGIPTLSCIVVEPNPPEDPDGDGVPTTLSVSFDPDPCQIGLGRATISLSGRLSITDPTPEIAAYDIVEELDEFGFQVSAAERSFMVMRSGRRSVAQDGNVLLADEQLEGRHVVNGEREKFSASDWTLRFEGEAAIAFREPLPSGALTIDGTWTWAAGDRERVFQVETVVALQYDATCTDVRPVHRFTAGEIHKRWMVNGRSRGTLIIVWTGCGERPTRTWVPADDGENDRPDDGEEDDRPGDDPTT